MTPGWLIAFGLTGLICGALVLFFGFDVKAIPLGLLGFLVSNRVAARIHTGEWNGGHSKPLEDGGS